MQNSKKQLISFNLWLFHLIKINMLFLFVLLKIRCFVMSLTKYSLGGNLIATILAGILFEISFCLLSFKWFSALIPMIIQYIKLNLLCASLCFNTLEIVTLFIFLRFFCCCWCCCCKDIQFLLAYLINEIFMSIQMHIHRWTKYYPIKCIWINKNQQQP